MVLIFLKALLKTILVDSKLQILNMLENKIIELVAISAHRKKNLE